MANIIDINSKLKERRQPEFITKLKKMETEEMIVEELETGEFIIKAFDPIHGREDEGTVLYINTHTNSAELTILNDGSSEITKLNGEEVSLVFKETLGYRSVIDKCVGDIPVDFVENFVQVLRRYVGL